MSTDWSGYHRSTWIRIGIFYGSAANDMAGASVALNGAGNYLAVGSPFNDPAAASTASNLTSCVRVYEGSSSGWSQLGSDVVSPVKNAYLGFATALSDDGGILAVGSPGGGASYAGQAAVYAFDHDNWLPFGQKIDGDAAFEILGASIALASDGLTFAVGMFSAGGSNPGRVQAYEISQVGNVAAWVQLGQNLDGDAGADLFGAALSLSADTTRLAVGAPQDTFDGKYQAGSARVFELTGTVWGENSTWAPLGQILGGQSAGDMLGTDVALSADGARLVVNAAFSTINTWDGYAKLYEFDGSQWAHIGGVNGEDADDLSWRTIALSGDALC